MAVAVVVVDRVEKVVVVVRREGEWGSVIEHGCHCHWMMLNIDVA